MTPQNPCTIADGALAEHTDVTRPTRGLHVGPGRSCVATAIAGIDRGGLSVAGGLSRDVLFPMLSPLS